MRDSSTSSSPFTGLDKALLRSSRATPPASSEPEQSPPAAVVPRPQPQTAPAPRPASRLASSQASKLASYPDELVNAIRKTVKSSGREVLFLRVTPEERSQLSDIAHTYKRRGRKTSDTEIARIAVSFILDDYHANGEQSLLARVLAALHD